MRIDRNGARGWRRRGTAALGCGVIVAGLGANAQADDLVIDDASTASVSIGVDAPFGGTLIGDFDEKSNPDGTRTLPGLFGGSGNQPIDYGATFVIDGSIDGAPSGGFSIVFDAGGSAASLDGLVLDVLGAGSGGVDLVVELTYETFRSINPDSLYVGGFTLPLPLGAFDVTAFTATQTASATLLLGPRGEDGVRAVTGLVPVDLVFSIDGPTGPIGGAPFPVVLPISGTYRVIDANQRVEFGLVFDEAIDVPSFLPPFDSVPIPLPTILPPGGIANVLLSGETADGSAAIALEIDLVAEGPLVFDADLDANGRVDGRDLVILLGAWGADRGPADFDRSGSIDEKDLHLLLGAWTE